MNIYEIALKILSHVVASESYQNSSFFNQTYSFLTTDNSPFEVFLKKYDNKSRINLKKIMMLIIFGDAYKMLLRNKYCNIDTDLAEELLDQVERLSAQEIIKVFFSEDSQFVREIFSNYFDYSERNYIFRNSCWELIQKKGRASMLFKINPFEIYNFENLITTEGFIHSEKVIQIFIDLYDRTSIIVDESFADDFSENIDNYLTSNTFKSLAEEFFAGDITQISNFYATILSNVYENLTINIKFYKHYQNVLDIFENNHGLDVISIFLNNKQFAERIIELFLMFNEDIDKEDLFNRRFKFLQSKNSNILEELNPYYDEEQQILKRYQQKIKE